MDNVGEKYLPIGTVVMLKGAKKRLMITGFCSMNAENKDVMYDYAGCMFPEGFISNNQTALFNHNQIEKVYHLGLSDDEEKKFKDQLNAVVKQVADKLNIKQADDSSYLPKEETSTTPAPTAENTDKEKKNIDLASIPPIGPGLPGYVAPKIENTPVAEPKKEEVAAPAPDAELKRDENGEIVADFQFDAKE